MAQQAYEYSTRVRPAQVQRAGMATGEEALKALEDEERIYGSKGKNDARKKDPVQKAAAAPPPVPAFSVPRDWEKFATSLMGPKTMLSGVCLLPINRDAPAGDRKSVIHAQKGMTLKVPEATALIDALMDGRVHKDYVHVAGQQYLITTLTENGAYGRCLSSSAVAGVVLVKTARTLVVATYTEPVVAAQAIPQVHKIADDLQSSGS